MLRLVRRSRIFPLRRTLRVGGVHLHNREILELRLMDGETCLASSEISPLPGLHHESLHESIISLEALWPVLKPVFESAFLAAPFIRSSSTPEVLSRFDREATLQQLRKFLDPLSSFSLLPSLRFALEALLMDGFYGRMKLQPSASSLTSALLFDGTEKEFKVFLEGQTLTPQAIKFKVGRQPLRDDVALLQLAHRLLPSTCEIRLDANRCWSEEELPTAAQAFLPFPITFVEEPCRCLKDLPKWRWAGGSPVALDESLWLEPNSTALQDPIVTALVLKPAMLGISSCLDFLYDPKEKALIFSSCFEGSLGMGILNNLTALAKKNEHPGFGTVDFLGFSEGLSKFESWL